MNQGLDTRDATKVRSQFTNADQVLQAAQDQIMQQQMNATPDQRWLMDFLTAMSTGIADARNNPQMPGMDPTMMDPSMGPMGRP